MKTLLRLCAALIFFWSPGLVHAQGIARQVGPVTAGHPAAWWGNGLLSDASAFPNYLATWLDENFGSTPGLILCRGQTGWTTVPPSTGGQILESTSINCPVWVNSPYQIAPVRTITAGSVVTVLSSDLVLCIDKASGSPTTVNLPATPLSGQTFTVKDCKGDAFTNNITINPQVGTIDGASSYVMLLNYQSTTVVYNGASWSIIG